MQIGMIGINHKSAGLLVREEVSRYLLNRFKSNVYTHLFPSVLLSTCLRSELYFSGNDLVAIHRLLLAHLKDQLFLNEEELLYSFFGMDCFFHLAAVTAGLDSLEVGESEIQRQVKEAYLDAKSHQLLPSELHFLFQKSLKIGKEMRSEFSFPKREALTSQIWERIITFFPDAHRNKFLFIGASETNKKVVRFLKSKGISNLTFCNRTEERAKAWAEKEGAEILSYGSWEHLFDYDLLFFATKSNHLLLKKEMVPPLFDRKLLFDLSFPRNVDPTLATNNLSLFSLMDLFRNGEEKSRSEKLKEHLTALVERQITLYEKRQNRQEILLLSLSSLSS